MSTRTGLGLNIFTDGSKCMVLVCTSVCTSFVRVNKFKREIERERKRALNKKVLTKVTFIK